MIETTGYALEVLEEDVVAAVRIARALAAEVTRTQPQPETSTTKGQ